MRCISRRPPLLVMRVALNELGDSGGSAVFGWLREGVNANGDRDRGEDEVEVCLIV